jgi:hypothetical protein
MTAAQVKQLLGQLKDGHDVDKLLNLSFNDLQIVGAEIIVNEFNPERVTPYAYNWYHVLEYCTDNRPVVQYDLSGEYSKDATLAYVQRILSSTSSQEFAKRTAFSFKGKYYYGVSIKLFKEQIEKPCCPLDITIILDEDGIGTKGLCWQGVSEDVMQLLHIAANYPPRELSIEQAGLVSYLRRTVSQPDALEVIALEYPKAAQLYVQDKAMRPKVTYQQRMQMTKAMRVKSQNRNPQTPPAPISTDSAAKAKNDVRQRRKFLGFQNQLDLLNQKLAELRKSLILENDSATIFKLKNQITEAEEEIGKIEAHMNSL